MSILLWLGERCLNRTFYSVDDSEIGTLDINAILVGINLDTESNIVSLIKDC
jgi:hypothetical protein